MDDRQPFLTREVLDAGLRTREQLLGPDHRRLFRGVRVSSHAAVDPPMRARAAALAHPDGVVAGHAAAALHGARCAPVDPTVEVVVTTSGARSQPGLDLRRGRLPPDEVVVVDGVAVTTPARTAFDLACRLPLVDAVVAADALGHAAGLTPDRLREVAARHPGARGVRRVGRVAELMEPGSSSPARTRLRLVLVLRGVPRPTVDHALVDESGAPWRADLAWPDSRVGLVSEYGGRVVVPGWRLRCFPPALVADGPDDVAHEVERVLRSAREDALDREIRSRRAARAGGRSATGRASPSRAARRPR